MSAKNPSRKVVLIVKDYPVLMSIPGSVLLPLELQMAVVDERRVSP